MTLLGIGSPAVNYGYSNETSFYFVASLAALFHLINHATFKGTVFMIVGIIDHETGTRDIRKLGGLMTFMPISFTLAIIGGFSMAGLPPFNGFLSKEMFYTGIINASQISFFPMNPWGYLLPILAWIASIFTFLYSFIFIFRTFTGKFNQNKLKKMPHEASLGLLISPIILASMVILLFFYPNILSYTILEPAMSAIFPNALNSNEKFYVNIYAWHGFNIELMMTIGVIIVGSILYFIYRRHMNTYHIFTQKDPLNRVYDISLNWLIRSSTYLTRLQMTGLLRDYLVYMLTFILFILGFTMVRFNAFSIDTSNLTPIPIYIWIVTLLLITTVVSIPFINNRVTVVLITGVSGYLIALLFVIFRAPDLALTQILVETIMLVLCIACFYHLPELRKEKFKPTFKFINLIISLGVGGIITLIALSVHSIRNSIGFESISQYFIENSYTLAGGKKYR